MSVPPCESAHASLSPADAGLAAGDAAPLTRDGLLRLFTAMRSSLERVIRRRCGDEETARDLTQDLYLRFERMGQRLSSEEHARRYLMRMATNAALDHLRAENCRTRSLSGLRDDASGYAADPADTFEIHQQYRALDETLTRLPSACREVLFLNRIEGLTHGEIAERLGLSKSSVEKYIMRALRACRQKMDAR